MRKHTDVTLYCDIAQNPITWTVCHELVPMLSQASYACYSMRCSEKQCSHHGIATECKILMAQAKKIAKDDLVNNPNY